LRGSKARLSEGRTVVTVRALSCLGMLAAALAGPASFAQQADNLDARWGRTTSGAQTSTSSNGEFSAEATIGVPEGSADPARADVFELQSGFVAGIVPPGVTLRPNAVFIDGYE